MARQNVITMKIVGGEELRRALLKKEAQFLAEMAQALPVEAQALTSQAAAAAPRASGQLAASAMASSAVLKKGQRIKAAAAILDDKAAAVHEGLHWRKKVEGTKGFKWFERVFRAFEPGFVDRIAARLRRVVGG
jgi:hypothetical protein